MSIFCIFLDITINANYYYGVNIVIYIYIDIKNVDKQLTHAVYIKDRNMNCILLAKLTKYHQSFLLNISHII